MAIQKIILKIKNMHCASCESTIGNALKKASGVIDASVSYPTEQANIEFDPKKISVDELIGIIKTTGYDASSAEEESIFEIGYELCFPAQNRRH